MIGTIITKDGTPTGTPISPISEYRPSKEVQDLTLAIKQDYEIGWNNFNKVFSEFNDMTLQQRMNLDQKIFNVWIPPQSEDEAEAWRWNGVSPKSRNKLISIAAHLVAKLVFPNVFAQNENDDEDKLASEVAGDLLEYNIRNSNYEISYLFGVIGALINPVSYLSEEFSKVMQDIKVRQADGKITKKQVIDEILSGFQVYNISPDEILIANPYQYELQRQRFIIRRKIIDYDEAKAEYGKHANFKYVKTGVQVLYNPLDGQFYEQADETNPTMVEMVKYYNRRDDTEVCFINGVYLGKDNVDDNLMKHRDFKNRPKYPLIKFGYEPIDVKRFFYYKSGAFKLAPDQDLIDKMLRMLVDGTFLSVMKPIMLSGDDQLDKSVIIPGGTTTVDKDTTITPLDLGGNLQAGYSLLERLDDTTSESTQDNIAQGQMEQGDRTAYEVARAERNALIQLGLFGKMIAQAVKEFGELMLEDIVWHQTVGEVDQLSDKDTTLKYKTFLVSSRQENGNTKTHKIVFTDKYLGKTMTEDEEMEASYDLLEKTKDSDMKLYEVNPEVFANMKFNIVFSADLLMPRSEEFENALKLQAFDRTNGDPYFDQEMIRRDFLLNALSVSKGKADKYLKSQADMMMGQQQMQQGGQPMAQKANTKPMAKMPALQETM